ncbi:MAG: DUF1592 domain-containing protein [Myxococcota bacterium]
MRVLMVLCCAGMPACQGIIGDTPASLAGADTSERPFVLGDQHTAIGVRRLTRAELGATIEDLLGVAGAETSLPPDQTIAFLSNNAHGLKVGLGDVEALARMSEAVAAEAVTSIELPLGCAVATLGADCYDAFAADFLPRAFRRPASDAELERYRALFDATRELDGDEDALAAVIAAVLQSPGFLYRTEIGDGGELTSWEIASRLSYLVWGTMPDNELLAAAAADRLRSPDSREAQLRRLLASSRAQANVSRFVLEWLGLGDARLSRKDPSVLDGLPADFEASTRAETRAFIEDTLVTSAGTVETLYASTHSFLNATLAAFYGVPGIAGDDLRRVSLPSRERRGLLTQASIFTAHAKELGYSVVQVGRFVRERVLCQELPPPPDDADTTLPAPPAGTRWSYREQFEAHAKEPICKGCHAFLDPPGYAFLPYDPVGRYRERDEHGEPFDTKGELIELDGGSAPFADAADFTTLIAGSNAAKDCFATMFHQWAYGRALAREDLDAFAPLRDDFATSGGQFTGLLTALVRAPEFTKPGPTR